MKEVPMRWVIFEVDNEFGRPVQMPEGEVPQEGVTTLTEGRDLQPAEGTTVIRDKGEIIQEQ